MRKAVVYAIVTLVVLLVVAGTWRYGRPAYRTYRENRSVAKAKQFFAARQYREASLSARQALGFNPANAEACRLMAEMAEMSVAPQVLDWRRRVAEISPTVENKLVLAASAIRHQPPPFPTATQVLQELSTSATNLVGYHVVSAELAIRLNRPEEAAASLEVAARLEPTNALHDLNLAVVRFQSTNAAVAGAARETLEKLSWNTNLAPVALRWLVQASMGSKDLASAENLSRRLLADPRSNLDDRLRHLTILKQSDAPGLNDYLARVQTESSTNAGALYATAVWMVRQGLVEDAMRWLSNCPPAIRAAQPAPLASVECFIARKDWIGLESFLQEQKWGETEFIRLAFLSLAAAQQKQTMAAETRWRSALREAGDRLGPLTTLLGMLNSWGREQGKEELLWQIAQRFPREQWVLRELDRRYSAAKNTRGLNKLYAAMAHYDSTNTAVKNNLASTSLLLKLNLPAAHDLAREAYAQQPENPTIVSTWAFSLHLQGKDSDALAVLDKLPVEVRAKPPAALYYGLVLVSLGQTDKAAPYLEAAGSDDLLPEEAVLLAEAKAARK